MDPPCDSMIERLIDSPMPLPCGFVVKKASNFRPAFSAGKPTPVSLTDIFTLPSSIVDMTVSTPPVSFIASMPLSMRFMSTC